MNSRRLKAVGNAAPLAIPRAWDGMMTGERYAWRLVVETAARLSARLSVEKVA